ncbi:MAG: cbb3-type cytochrome c oxidase subunit 3 [Gammaproteobacteria bacterium]|nr:cbb3-type cytochrome c oxidase subunit 3 [Gammaproteobacteria bacterium]
MLILVFMGIVIWAWSSRRRRDFEEASRLPLDDEDREQQNGQPGNRHG